jgi:hypothetical protein
MNDNKDLPAIEKVQLAAQFSVDVDGFREPGTFGPVEMTAREWASFDLQAAIEKGVADAGIVRDELPRDEHGNHGTDQGHGNTIIETP